MYKNCKLKKVSQRIANALSSHKTQMKIHYHKVSYGKFQWFWRIRSSATSNDWSDVLRELIRSFGQTKINILIN